MGNFVPGELWSLFVGEGHDTITPGELLYLDETSQPIHLETVPGCSGTSFAASFSTPDGNSMFKEIEHEPIA